MEVDRIAFLQLCKINQASMKDRPGSKKITLDFEPGKLKMSSCWGGGVADTTGKLSVSVTMQFMSLKRVVQSSGITKLKSDTFFLTIALIQRKFAIEDAFIMVVYDPKT